MLGSDYTRAPWFREYESAAQQAADAGGMSPGLLFGRSWETRGEPARRLLNKQTFANALTTLSQRVTFTKP